MRAGAAAAAHGSRRNCRCSASSGRRRWWRARSRLGPAGATQGGARFLPRHRRAGDAGARGQIPHPGHRRQVVGHSPAFPAAASRFFLAPARLGDPPRSHHRLDGQDGRRRQAFMGRSRGQVARAAVRSHLDRRGQSSRAGARPRAGMRQAQQGSDGDPFQRLDGPAYRREPPVGRQGQGAGVDAHRQLGGRARRTGLR